ncbi:MAG TPA: FAD-binding oxidoreductase [Acidobacteria bacterium]|nr:lactate dehydrogenase [Acidobacteriota bacterium]HCE02652.1 FAD-binding oxidoreductase [Acidobacteriota bacterium]
MSHHRVRARPPRTTSPEPARRFTHDSELTAYLEDAAHFPDGHSSLVVCPRDEQQLATVLRDATTVLPVGAQSSLTGGATPMGDTVISLSELSSIAPPELDSVTAGAGVTLTALREALTGAGRAYPPVPTYEGATVGGIVSTNAAGAATFKYGTTRQWVRALTVMLANGDVLDLERGQVRATDHHFEIDTSDGTLRVPVPTYRVPEVPKRAAGYPAGPDLDLIDLFVGAEGTLGIVTSVTLEVLPRCPEVGFVLVACRDESQAVALASDLRQVSMRTWRDQDPTGLDVIAIEHMDRRCLALLREDGSARRLGVTIPDDADTLLLAQIEFPPGTTTERVYDEVASATTETDVSGAGSRLGSPVASLCRVIGDADRLDATEIVGPGDRARASALLALREAVPDAVNRRVGIAKRTVDGTIEKTAADMIVPFGHLGESLTLFRGAFESRGLDYAIWGHLSDANLHPNVIPRSADDVRRGKEAILECGRRVIELGGCPLAEHGVGRNVVKQALLRQLYGERGLAEMHAVKQALDPSWKLAPGVLLP